MSQRITFSTVHIPDIESVLAEKERLSKHNQHRRLLVSLTSSLVVLTALVTLSISLFFPVLQVTGISMQPSLSEGSIVLGWKPESYERGDICFFYHQNKLLLKRVIGLPGDIIDIAQDGTVSVNGEALVETYVNQKSFGDCNISFPFQVPDDSYFVLGDNRLQSVDSRNSAIGCVSSNQMEGKVIFKIWPFGPISS